MRKFVVVGRARSSVLFNGDEKMTARGDFGGREVAFSIGTHLSKQHGADVPRGVFVEVLGEAEELRDAVEVFTNRANALLGILAVGANAFIDHLEFELVFEITEGTTEREFLQALIPPAPPLAFPARRVNRDLLSEFASAVLSHANNRRLLRSIAHYRDMLWHWHLEERLRCVTQAFVAAEALGRIALRRELTEKDVCEEQLALTLGVDVTRHNWRNALLGRIREAYVFHCDRETYQSAKRISDAYEHSYSDFDALRGEAERVVSRTAAHVRQAILELSGVAQYVREELLAGPLNKPMGPPRLVHYVFGHLIGDGPELAAADQAYPILAWRHRIVPSKDPTSGEIIAKMQGTMTPRLADGISLRLGRYEIWDGSTFVEPGEQQEMLKQARKVNIELTSGKKPEIDGAFALNAPDTESLFHAVGAFVTNCGALASIVKFIVDQTVKDRKKRRRAKSMRAMARAIIEHMEQQDRVEPDLISLLQEVGDIETARRIATEGIMVFGWQGEAVGKPKQAMMVRTRPGRRNERRSLEEEEMRQLSAKVAVLARRLQAWFEQANGVPPRSENSGKHSGTDEEGTQAS